MSKIKRIDGLFVSNWSEGKVVTPCRLDPITGELFTKSANVGDLGTLESEKFYVGGDEDGDEYNVCPDCHEYILKTVMNPGISHGLNEEPVCSNFDCDSNSQSLHY